jgi:hypothetical protein
LAAEPPSCGGLGGAMPRSGAPPQMDIVINPQTGKEISTGSQRFKSLLKEFDFDAATKTFRRKVDKLPSTDEMNEDLNEIIRALNDHRNANQLNSFISKNQYESRYNFSKKPYKKDGRAFLLNLSLFIISNITNVSNTKAAAAIEPRPVSPVVAAAVTVAAPAENAAAADSNQMRPASPVAAAPSTEQSEQNEKPHPALFIHIPSDSEHERNKLIEPEIPLTPRASDSPAKSTLKSPAKATATDKKSPTNNIKSPVKATEKKSPAKVVESLAGVEKISETPETLEAKWAAVLEKYAKMRGAHENEKYRRNIEKLKQCDNDIDVWILGNYIYTKLKLNTYTNESKDEYVKYKRRVINYILHADEKLIQDLLKSTHEVLNESE